MFHESFKPVRFEKVHFHWFHQWDSFLPRVNWRDFEFLHIGGEIMERSKHAEARITVLGIGCEVTINWGKKGGGNG